MSKYILYGGRFSRALICEMVLIKAGLDYELRQIDLVGKENQDAHYKTINPTGMVPSLITPEGRILYETPAINLYIAEQHRIEELVPAAHDLDRGMFLSGLFFISSELEPAFKRYFYPRRYIMRKKDKKKMRQHSLGWIMHLLDIIDLRLRQNGPFCLGDRFSLVDLTLAYWISQITDRRRLSDIPAVVECYDRVAEIEPFVDKFESLHLMRDQYEILLLKGRGKSAPV